MSRHAALVAGLPPREKRRVLKQSLQYHDHDVALAILFLLIDPKYAPDMSANSFSDWNSIPTNLEFDHKGGFQKVIRNLWKYEGGESKSLIDGMFVMLKLLNISCRSSDRLID